MALIVVTGASGFVGGAVLRRLAERGDEVVAVGRSSSVGALPAGVTWVVHDLSLPITDSLPIRVDAVIHLAQSRRFREFPSGAVDVFDVNAAATVRLLDYARRSGADTFVYASSGAVYGASTKLLDESDRPSPTGFYAMSKLVGEQAVEQFRKELRGHCLRYFFVYGPHQTNMLIPGLIASVRDGRAVALADADGLVINPVYVDDAADATLACLNLKEGHTVNVAGLDVVSIREIAEMIGRLVKKRPVVTAGGSGGHLVGSIVNQSELLGPPRTRFATGLASTVHE